MPTAQAMLRTCPRRPNQPRLALSLNRGHNLAAVKVPSPFGERKNAGDDFSGANPVSADRVRDEPRRLDGFHLPWTLTPPIFGWPTCFAKRCLYPGRKPAHGSVGARRCAMKFLVSLFSSEKSNVSATGSWKVTAESADQAISLARFYADSRLWPPGSTWLCVPLDDNSGSWEAGDWKPT